MFKKELLEKISLEKNDFSIEVEILAKALLHTSNYKEIAISYNGRSYEDGKKIKFIDSLKYVLAIIRYR